MYHVKMKINGKEHENDVEPRQLLVHYIRDTARLTGTHVGCDSGNCGACTVLWNGKLIKACLMLAVQADGAEITTIEGISTNGLHPVQEAFIHKFAIQCGFCTPGMVLNACSLLQSNPHPTELEIRDHLEGNICMCTGYQQIIDAILSAAETMRSAGRK